jgi:hypothetical protein
MPDTMVALVRFLEQGNGHYQNGPKKENNSDLKESKLTT